MAGVIPASEIALSIEAFVASPSSPAGIVSITSCAPSIVTPSSANLTKYSCPSCITRRILTPSTWIKFTSLALTLYARFDDTELLLDGVSLSALGFSSRRRRYPPSYTPLDTHVHQNRLNVCTKYRVILFFVL